MTEPNSSEVPSTTKYQTSGAFKSSKDRKSKERKVLGDIEVFRDLIFIKANPSKTNDAAVKFNRTREKFIEYARTAWPESDISRLIQYEVEQQFTEPKQPKSTKEKPADEFAIIKYKTELSQYLTQVENYRKNKAAAFGAILGQCHQDVKDYLYRNSRTPLIQLTQ